MTTRLRFRDHSRFHRSAVAMAAAGLLAAIVVHAAKLAPTSWLFFAAIAVATAGVAAWQLANRRIGGLIMRALTVGAGVTGFALLPGWQGVMSLAGGLAVAIVWDLRGKHLVIALVAAAAAAVAALYASQQIAFAAELADMPSWARLGLAGLGFGAIAALALLPGQLYLHTDAVAAAYEPLRAGATGEVRELVIRAHGVWQKSGENLAEGDDNRIVLEQAVLRLFDTARRWTDSSGDGAGKAAASLEERMSALDTRIAVASDKVTRTQYQQAKQGLAEQLRYIRGIDQNRERVVARMHNYLAAMERLRLAVINVKSGDASREDVGPMVTSLAEIGDDLDGSLSNLNEVPAPE